MMKQRGLLSALSLTALMAAGCSGGLGDGVALESIDIRTANGTLDADGNATGDNLTIGRCTVAPLIFTATYSDGEVAQFADRAKWTSSDESVIAIINSRNVDNSLNRQFPLAIAPTSGSNTVQLTANFAGRTDTVNVTVVDSELVIEPLQRTFAVGVETPLSARQIIGGAQTILRSGSVNWVSDSPDLEIGSKDSDNSLGFGVMSAASNADARITADLDLNFFGLDLSEFFYNDGSNVDNVCNDSAATNVMARVPTSYEIVPTFVSENSTNQSSVNSLFLASGTTADVDVEAVFDNDQRQNVTANVVWKYNAADQATADNNASDQDSTNDTPLLPLPAMASGRIRAGLDDHNIAGNPQLIATVRLGDLDTSENRADGDLDDVDTTLTVMVDDYADAEIELLLTPAEDGLLAFGAVSQYRVIGLFGNPDRDQQTAELVLDLTAGNLFPVGETTPDTADGEVRSLFSAVQGDIVVVAKPDEDAGTLPLANSQALEFELRGEIPTGETTGVVRASTDSISFVLAEADLDKLDNDDVLAISLDGETAAADGLCLELGQTLDFEALVLFAAENGDDILPSLVTEPVQASLNRSASNGTVWSVSGGDTAITVRNDNGVRGRVTVIGTTPTMVTLNALYINNKEIDGDDATEMKIEIADTLELTIMGSGGCGESEEETMGGGTLL